MPPAMPSATLDTLRTPYVLQPHTCFHSSLRVEIASGSLASDFHLFGRLVPPVGRDPTHYYRTTRCHRVPHTPSMAYFCRRESTVSRRAVRCTSLLSFFAHEDTPTVVPFLSYSSACMTAKCPSPCLHHHERWRKHLSSDVRLHQLRVLLHFSTDRLSWSFGLRSASGSRHPPSATFLLSTTEERL